MTEKDFINEAKKRGLNDKDINELIEIFYFIKKEMPNLELNEMIIDCAIKTQEKIDNETVDFITLD